MGKMDLNQDRYQTGIKLMASLELNSKNIQSNIN